MVPINAYGSLAVKRFVDNGPIIGENIKLDASENDNGDEFSFRKEKLKKIDFAFITKFNSSSLIPTGIRSRRNNLKNEARNNINKRQILYFLFGIY